MSKEVGGMVGSRRVQGAGSARTEGARRASGVADGAAVGAEALAPGCGQSMRNELVEPDRMRGRPHRRARRHVGYRRRAGVHGGRRLGLDLRGSRPLNAECVGGMCANRSRKGSGDSTARRT